MIPGSANPLLLASAAGSPAPSYQIERSLRFNSSDSAYLGRDFITAGNRKTWTWSGWVKRSLISSGQQTVFGNYDGASGAATRVGFQANDVLWFQVGGSGGVYRNITSAVYRDPGAWLHLVAALDTTQATASNRVKLWVNGQLQTFTTTDYPSLDYAGGHVNQGIWHAVGSEITDTTVAASSYFNGCLADIHFIDGQALDPTSFGEFDANGVWQPKAYTGSYPGNSFHLDFADNSAATTAGIGKDVSGNGNDWTPVNLSVAAGASNDSLVDTPTNYGTDTGAGGEVRGNYCTWNPIAVSNYGTTPWPIVNGALDANDNTSNIYGVVPGTMAVSSGKWYWEVAVTTGLSAIDFYAGVGIESADVTDKRYKGSYGSCYYYNGDGTKLVGTVGSAYGTAWVSGDVIGVALNLDAGSVTFYRNNTSQGAISITLGSQYRPVVGDFNNANGTNFSANFGQRPFAYPAPSGFKALCTTNLPEPQTITTSGSYTGNGVADGPFVYLNGVPTAMTVNGNAVTFGTEADRLSNGFKVRTTSTTYNQNAVIYNYSITSTGDPFKRARAQSNP